MKHLLRLLLGIFASLLLTAGFARSAAALDPLARDLKANQPGAVLLPAPTCATECNLADRQE